MNMIKLSEATPSILSFENGVLECFFDEGGSKRVHIMHIKGMGLEASGKGKYLLTIKLQRDQMLLWVDEGAQSKVIELIAEVQKAMASFKL
jgi:hypothetical protein